ncbi:hypothetical protein ACHQM5_005158 [Ranunculus cassubicifolius]
MVRPKTSSKKPQKRGVDFQKYKRKLGRKLPPPKNATNTEIKSAKIIVREQSVAFKRDGLAVSKKGLTLEELLIKTSHHSPKDRKDALIGIKDLASKHPSELKLHKFLIIEKLCKCISDADKVVRETLYQLLKSVIFPGCKEEIPGSIISSIMVYIFNAMTDLAPDIRLMAFKFFELVVQHFPSSFLLHAEKILLNYEDILKMNHTYLQDKGKLKNALGGLLRCLSLFPSAEGKANSCEMTTDARGTLHAFEPEVPTEHTDFSYITDRLEHLIPVLVNCFKELIPSVLEKPVVDSMSYECMLCVIQSIDLALKHFIYGSKTRRTDFKISVLSLSKVPGATIWGENTLPILLKKLLEVFPLTSVHNSAQKNDERYYILNVALAEIFLNSNDWTETNISLEKVLEFVENALCGKICCSSGSSKALREKYLVSLLRFIPNLVLQAESNLKIRVLQAFTEAFRNCKPESSLKLACLSAIEEMLLHVDLSFPDISPFQIAWMRELPLLLVQLGDKFPSSSKIVLHLHLRLGQHVPMGSSLALEYDYTQELFIEFYSTFNEDITIQGGIQYGPFISLPRDCQELAICSLYYFSYIDLLLLKSLTYCCLCDTLDPYLVIRIIEVLQSSHKAGRIHIADQISFLFTLLARFRNFARFKFITSTICSCLVQMGDNDLVLQILLNITIHEMSFLSMHLDNTCAMLLALASLYGNSTLLSEDITIALGDSIFRFMVDSAHCIPENMHELTGNNELERCRYYFFPCFVLFNRNGNILNRVLNLMRSVNQHEDTLDQSNRLKAVGSIVLFMHRDATMKQSLSRCKALIKRILQEIIVYQSLGGTRLSLEDGHKIRVGLDELKMVTGRIHGWSADEFSTV